MTKYYKICSFFGNSEIVITDELIGRLRVKIEELVTNEGFGVFYFGGLGMFDDLCYKIVSELKEKYPFIKRVFCLTDPRHQRYIKRPSWLRNTEYEEYIYLDLAFDWWYKRIYYRNCEMIEQSDFVIFYVAHTEKSGAYKAMQYAKRKKKNYINIATNLDNQNF